MIITDNDNKDHHDKSDNGGTSDIDEKVHEEVAINEILPRTNVTVPPKTTITANTTTSSDEYVKKGATNTNANISNSHNQISPSSSTLYSSMDPFRYNSSSPASMLSMISDTMVPHGKASEETILRPILWLAFEDLMLAPLRRVLPSRRRHSEILDGESDLLNFF